LPTERLKAPPPACKFDFNVRPTSISDYDKFFKLIDPPNTQDEQDFDAAFVRIRLSGVNPLALSKCDVEDLARFNLDPAQLENLTAVAKAGRLWIEDYSGLASFTLKPFRSPTDPNINVSRYTEAPMALFETPLDAATRKREGLVPVLIQMNPGKTGQVVHPNQGYLWHIAKAFVNR